MNPPCDLHSLWIGPRLGLLQRLSVASWLAHGHRAVIWVYDAVDGVPREADIRDAREILPESAISYHRESGSVSLFSNRFRS